jgi:Zn-dependent protease with chaperone function
VSVATHQAPPALRNPAEIPIYVLCVILNVVIAVLLVGLAIIELAPTPMHALVIISTPLRLAVAAILLATFVFGILFVLGRQLTRASSRGNSVLASSNQFPDIDAMLRESADRLGFRQRRRQPEIYVEAGNGVLNAFAASTFGHDYVVVNSDLFANTLEQNRRALRFIVGHELGHIRLGHTRFWYQMSICYSGAVPLLGPYLSRLRELSSDRNGAWVEPEGGDGLVLLTAGRYIYHEVRIPDLLDQARKNVGFWNTVAQLQLSHPFTVRRVAELSRLGLIHGSSPAPPRGGVATGQGTAVAAAADPGHGVPNPPA